MGLKDIVQGALAVIRDGYMTDAEVTVISDGDTAQGVKDERIDATDLGSMAEGGITSGRVRVSAADLARPDKGATISVDGADVVVTNVSTDSLGALLVIDYQITTPVEGV